MNKKRQRIEDLPEILTLKEASDVLNCHPNTLRNWDNQGILRAIRLGKRKDRRYRKQDILKIINKNSGRAQR